MSEAAAFTTAYSINPSRSDFDLSQNYRCDLNIGDLIPVYFLNCAPGDSFRLSSQSLLRTAPLVNPIYDELTIKYWFFFVPYRLLWDDWENFITGGEDGNFSAFPPPYVPVKAATEISPSTSSPYYTPADPSQALISASGTAKYSLWDYLQIGLINTPAVNQNVNQFEASFSSDSDWPNGFNQRAYNLIYNEYFRDQNYMEEVPYYNNSILKVTRLKDYFFSVLPSQQRGTAPAIPLSGVLNAVFPNLPLSSIDKVGTFRSSSVANFGAIGGGPALSATDASASRVADVTLLPTGFTFNGDKIFTGNFSPSSSIGPRLRPSQDPTVNGNVYISSYGLNYLNSNSIDASDIASFTIADLRAAVQLQVFLELSNIAGARYKEYLQAHFGVSPRDERLQRPEFVGGCKSPIYVSEVLQTSGSTDSSALGSYAGHGISGDQNNIGDYYVLEEGVLMGLCSVTCRPSYQQGAHRSYFYKNRFDFYHPEFAHLAEQPVFLRELYYTHNKIDDVEVFGYTGVFNEYRCSNDYNVGAMKDYLKTYHLGMIFDSKPRMNRTLLELRPNQRIFSVQDTPDWKTLFLWSYTRCESLRPLPLIPMPGLMDHLF